MKSSDIVQRLASTMNRRDEVPNQELAKEIVERKDTVAVESLLQLLNTGSLKVRKDCIKVAYEIGAQNPGLISAYASSFLELLKSKDNRLQWGAMTALDCIALEVPDQVFSRLPEIISAAEIGSVITKDHAIEILVKLSPIEKHSESILPILIEFLANSALNQFPKYAERIGSVVTTDYKVAFLSVLDDRLNELDSEAKRKRILKVIKKAG